MLNTLVHWVVSIAFHQASKHVQFMVEWPFVMYVDSFAMYSGWQSEYATVIHHQHHNTHHFSELNAWHFRVKCILNLNTTSADYERIVCCRWFSSFSHSYHIRYNKLHKLNARTRIIWYQKNLWLFILSVLRQ